MPSHGGKSSKNSPNFSAELRQLLIRTLPTSRVKFLNDVGRFFLSYAKRD